MNLRAHDFGGGRDTSRLNLAKEVDEGLSRSQWGVADGDGIESGARVSLSLAEGGVAGSAPERHIHQAPDNEDPERDQNGQPQRLITTVQALREALRSIASINRDYVDRLQRTIAEQEEEIAALRTEVAERTRDIVALKADVAERNADVASLQRESSRRDMEIGVLRSEVAGREEKISALYASTSWRITKPIRAMKHLGLATSSTIINLWRRKSRTNN
jgi:predicted RNase H-like nuclease (RuvC/YqgF family)